LTNVGPRLRVLFVTTSLMRGGAETQVFLLAKGLALRGHGVGVVSLREPEAYVGELVDLGVTVDSLAMRSGVADPRALLRLARVVHREHPQVVHGHMIHANLLARLARPLAWSPVLVSTAHNLIEGGRARDLAYRLTDPLTTLTTNVAQAAVDRFVRVGAVPARRIRRMPNGLDVDAFVVDPAARAQTRDLLGVGDEFLWLTVGRLDPQKDYAVLLEAVANLPRPGRTVLIAGDGPLRGALEAEANRRGLMDGTVRFLGARSDVPNLMAAADAFVLSSAWEGLPMVLLEAAASSLPAVVTDVGGNAEVVVHERTGVVLPAHDPEALSSAMRRLEATPPAERAAWGHAARAHVEQHFHIDRVIDGWEALYLELLGPRASSRGSR
jgi:glycosyltransferase involved in cell wall biosynthesis